MPKSREELKRTMPTLRPHFESSRALVERAHETAARVVEAADAMRTLLHSDHDDHRPAAPERDVWETAAREVLQGRRDGDRVLGLLSHEFRQALTAAIAAERLLRVSDDREAAGRARAVLQRQLEHLSRLVEDLVDFSRASLTPSSIALRDVNVDDVIARSAKTVEPVIAERGQCLTITKAAGSPVVTGDPTRLQQVFSNLLHNAARFTPSGGHIDVTSFVEVGWTRVDVHDDGIGIDPSQLEAIFEPCARRSPEGPGLSIGLSLARRLTELHGGTITAQSDGCERGTTFTVRLPLASPRLAGLWNSVEPQHGG